MTKVPTTVHSVLYQVFKSQGFGNQAFKKPEIMAWYLRTIKEDEVAIWIENNKPIYLAGLIDGFESDNEQDILFKKLYNRVKFK